MVLLRRLTGLIVAALLVALFAAGVAVADGKAVLADYDDDGVIQNCYSDADFTDALRLARSDQQAYGAGVDLIQERQLECAKTRATTGPVTAVAGDGGGGKLLWVVVGVAGVAGLAVFAAVAWGRRRPGADDGDL